MDRNHVLLSAWKIYRSFYHTICDFSKKKNLTQKITKTWSDGRKQRRDLDSAQKTTLEMMHLIPWTHRSYFVDQCKQLYNRLLPTIVMELPSGQSFWCTFKKEIRPQRVHLLFYLQAGEPWPLVKKMLGLGNIFKSRFSPTLD